MVASLIPTTSSSGGLFTFDFTCLKCLDSNAVSCVESPANILFILWVLFYKYCTYGPVALTASYHTISVSWRQGQNHLVFYEQNLKINAMAYMFSSYHVLQHYMTRTLIFYWNAAEINNENPQVILAIAKPC